MFNVKYKILSKIKDKLIFHLKEKEKYHLRCKDWENKSYNDVQNKHCYSEVAFNKTKEEQIKWSHQQWLLHHYKCELLEDIIKEIKNE